MRFPLTCSLSFTGPYLKERERENVHSQSLFAGLLGAFSEILWCSARLPSQENAHAISQALTATVLTKKRGT